MNSTQQASHPCPPDFHADLWGYGGIPGDHTCGHSSWFPCGNSSEMMGNFLCVYFRLISLWFDIILWWIKMSTGLGKLPSHSNPFCIIFPPNFHMDSRFTYNPNFNVDSLHPQPQSLGIPNGIREILPAGLLPYPVLEFPSFGKSMTVNLHPHKY